MHHPLNPRYALPVLVACALASGASRVSAEPKGDPAAQQAVRKAQGMLRELSQQKAQLETENASLKEQIAKLEATVKQLEPLQAIVEKDKSSIESLKSSTGALESELSREKERYSQFQTRHQTMVTQAKKIQADNQHLVAAVKEREQWIGQCGQRNKDLLKSGGELVTKYKEKGFWDKLAELEPVTGIGKVAAENVEQEYRFKLQDLQVTPYKDSAQVAASAAEQAPPPADEDDDKED